MPLHLNLYIKDGFRGAQKFYRFLLRYRMSLVDIFELLQHHHLFCGCRDFYILYSYVHHGLVWMFLPETGPKCPNPRKCWMALPRQLESKGSIQGNVSLQLIPCITFLGSTYLEATIPGPRSPWIEASDGSLQTVLINRATTMEGVTWWLSWIGILRWWDEFWDKVVPLLTIWHSSISSRKLMVPFVLEVTINKPILFGWNFMDFIEITWRCNVGFVGGQSKDGRFWGIFEEWK